MRCRVLRTHDLATYDANVRVDSHDPSIRSWHEQFTDDMLFDGNDDAILAFDTDGGSERTHVSQRIHIYCTARLPRVLDSLVRVFDFWQHTSASMDYI